MHAYEAAAAEEGLGKGGRDDARLQAKRDEMEAQLVQAKQQLQELQDALRSEQWARVSE